VKLAQKKRDDNLKLANRIKSNEAPTVHRICINKSHRSRTLHLLVGVGNNLVEGLVNTRTSMLVISTSVVRELGIMHSIIGMESYKTATRIITQNLGRMNEITIKVGKVQCLMTFMVVDIDSYDLLFKLNFLIKIETIVDVKKGTIQVK
jgi:hypothetical protein